MFEAETHVVMGASMIAVRGRIQREGEVVHLVARKLADLSDDLASIGARDAAFPLPHGRADQVTHADGGPDPRELPPKGLRTRNIYRAQRPNAIKVIAARRNSMFFSLRRRARFARRDLVELDIARVVTNKP